MTDKELLEKAAKIAGYPQGAHTAPVKGSGLLMQNDLYWCPLTDDGDAFRLQVALRFVVAIEPGGTWVLRHMRDPAGVYELTSTSEQKYGDRNLATRRAIVRAAANLA